MEIISTVGIYVLILIETVKFLRKIKKSSCMVST